MPVYEITTDKGVYQVETDSSNSDLSNKFIPQLTKGLYEKVPFGKRVISMLPNAEQIQKTQETIPEPRGIKANVGRFIGNVAPDATMMAPFLEAGMAIKAPAAIKAGVGLGSYGATKAAVTGSENPLKAGARDFAIGAGTVGAGQLAGKAIKGSAKAIMAAPNKILRGGISKQEAARVEQQYGSSIGSLVDTVKGKLNQAISYADDMYGKVFQNTPENKFINIRPSIEEAGSRLRKLGLVTKTGNLTELGKSEIARDSVYGKLLDFYKSADAISGVKKLQGKSLTQSQMIKSFKAERETMVNKDQFLFLRDKLNSLYKNKPSDIDVNRVVDSFYQSGEDSGLKGLQAARRLEREAFKKADKFIDAKGDLKIANEARLKRIGMDRPLSQAEIQHIKELEQYTGHQIIKDAEAINKLNKAKEILQNMKQYGKGATGATIAGELGRKIFTGRW